MDNSKKISIIMGIYNCADTLSEAIDSIMNQTYTNWQMILCDDGSVDNTYAVAKAYAEKYPEKFILTKNDKNRGLNYTLNHCLKYADGDYIARMDGDDISMPSRFEKEVTFLNENPQYSIVSTQMIYFDDEGDFLKSQHNGEPPLSQFAKGTPLCHAPCMVRREAYEAINGYSESKKRLRVEDWDLWIRMYENGYRGFSINEPLYKMRDDKNAYSRRKFKYRINEARVSAYATKKLKLGVVSYIWVVRPILVGLLPNKLYDYLHKRKMK